MAKAKVKQIDSSLLAFNRAQTAKLLGLSKPKITDLIQSGKLRHRREGRRVLISREAISEYLNGGTN